jgi:hypothetical protein
MVYGSGVDGIKLMSEIVRMGMKLLSLISWMSRMMQGRREELVIACL